MRYYKVWVKRVINRDAGTKRPAQRRKDLGEGCFFRVVVIYEVRTNKCVYDLIFLLSQVSEPLSVLCR